MDGESFDRLSRAVDRLRGSADRRGALRLLFGGSLAAALTVLAAPDGDARRRRRNRDRRCQRDNFYCRGDGDCCSNNCWYNICRPRGGGSCQQLGWGCYDNRDCCSGRCSGNRCVSRAACRSAGQGCNSNNDCCSGRCFGNICSAGGCFGNGVGCASDAACCSGRCRNNVCEGGGGGGGSTCNCGPGTNCCRGSVGSGCCASGFRCCRGGLFGNCCPSTFRCYSDGFCGPSGVRRGGARSDEVIEATPAAPAPEPVSDPVTAE